MQVRVPNKTTLSYSLVEVIVNIINLNITVSYKQFYQLRMEAGLHATKSTMLTVREHISQPPTLHREFLDALRVYLSLLGPLFSFKRTVLRLCNSPVWSQPASAEYPLKWQMQREPTCRQRPGVMRLGFSLPGEQRSSLRNNARAPGPPVSPVWSVLLTWHPPFHLLLSSPTTAAALLGKLV